MAPNDTNLAAYECAKSNIVTPSNSQCGYDACNQTIPAFLNVFNTNIVGIVTNAALILRVTGAVLIADKAPIKTAIDCIAEHAITKPTSVTPSDSRINGM
tara:strand:- start:3 stop:302 length:300 start_codon:yes stop_codon:yes gene_type:complete